MIANPKTITSWATTGLAVFCFLAFCLPLVSACDCGSSDSSDGANSDDDDVVADDDTSADDDVDDDAGTTTTTSPTTSTIPTSSTTTTVVTTSSTTTTIPGSGTACDPYRYTAADGPDVPDFGPWPEYTIGAITYRQYIAGNAGIGRSAVALDAGGRAWVFGMVGRSFDAYVFDDDGSVEREIVDPAGGADSEIFLDENGAFHVVYTNNNLNEIRYATNESGEWTQTVVLSDTLGAVGFGAARASDGTLHIVWTRFEFDQTGVQYFAWNGGIVAQEEIRAPDGANRFWAPSVALDSLGRPNAVYSGDDGIWYAVRTDTDWDGARVADGNGDTDILIDEGDVVRLAFGGFPSGLYYADNESGDWAVSVVDNCSADHWYVRLFRDASGAYHFVYPENGFGSIRHATNASGAWVFEEAHFLAGAYLGATIAPDGTVHTASCSQYPEPALFYATNKGGGWEKRLIAGGHDYGFSNFALDADGYLSLVVGESKAPNPGVMYYAADSFEGWLFEVIEVGPADYFADIAISQTGQVAVVYADLYTTIDEIKFARRIEDGEWDVESVYVSGDVNDGPRLIFDNDNEPHIAFRNRPYPGYAIKTGSTWAIDMLPDSTYGDMDLDNAGLAHMVTRTNSAPWIFHHLWRDDDGNWLSEPIRQPTAIGYSWMDMDVDVDGFVHTLYCCESGGVGYASNQSGSWETTLLGNWRQDQGAFSLIADESGSAHTALMKITSRPGLSSSNSLNYGTNITSNFQYFKIDDRWSIDPRVTIHWGLNGEVIIGYRTLGAFCTAIFAPGVE